MTSLLRQKPAMKYSLRWVYLLILAVVLLGWTAAGWAITPAPGTPIVNRVTAQGSDANGNPLPEASATVATPLAGAPLFRLEKTASSDPVAAGATFSYTIRYENTGNAPATGVMVVDTLPAGLAFQTASAGGVHNPLDRTVTWNLGSLAVGTGGFLTVTVKVADGLAIGTPIINTALMTCTEGAQTSVQLRTMVGVGVNLVLTKTAAPGLVTPNGTIVYTLAFRNLGNAAAHQVRIVDQLPLGTAYVLDSAAPAAILVSNLLSWNLGEIAAGGQGSVIFQVRVSPLAATGDRVSNFATISSLEQTSISNTVSTIVSSQSLLLLKMATPDPVRAGQNLTYLLQVENTGVVPLTGVTLSDPLPIGTTFVSADSGGILIDGGRQVVWSIGDLAVGQKQTSTLVVQVDPTLTQGLWLENTATVTSNETPVQSVRALSTVNGRTPGEVLFLDAGGVPTIGYHAGETIFVQVQDLDRNLDPTGAETVTIVLTNLQTKDSETLILTETGADSGIFRGGILSTLELTGPGNGALTVTADSRIQATYNDSLDAGPALLTSALIDPLGIVFDAVNGNPLAGAVVTLRSWNSAAAVCDLTSWPVLPPGQVNPAAPTGADGKFAFPLVPAGDYCYEVKPPPGYLFPSTVADVDLPVGYIIGLGSRGGAFTLNIGDPPLISDIPVDPPMGRLTISKSAGKTTAAIGDLIAYHLKLANIGAAPVTSITLTDVMPHGLQILPGSARLNNEPLADPTALGNRGFAWSLPGLEPNKELEITYRAVVGPDATRGDGINTAFAAGLSLGKAIASNTASVKVKITAGIFTEKGTILGKIFLDRDGNRMQQQSAIAKPDDPDEPGLPNLILYLEDGSRISTDQNGKFSLLGVAPGTHILRVDESTLPRDMGLVPIANRFLGEGSSQMVTMPPGGLVQADFAVRQLGPVAEENPPADPAPAVAEQTGAEVAPLVSPGEAATRPHRQEGIGSGGVADWTPDPGKRDWEEEIKTMSPVLAFLSPADENAHLPERIRVVVKAPFESELSLSVNGVPVDARQIGRKIDYQQGQVTIWEYIDVHLTAGATNLLRVEAKDLFGIVRGSKAITVLAVGTPERLVIQTDQTEAVADGESQLRVRVELRDKNDLIVPYAGLLTISVSAGELGEKDADPAAEGFQVALRQGVGTFTVRAPREAGEAVITAAIDGRQATTQVFFTPHLRSLFLVGLGEMTIGQGHGQGEYGFLADQSWFEDGSYTGGRGAFFLKGEVYRDVLLTAAYDSDKEKRDDLFRENDTTLDSEDKYPIYGDESKTSYEALSTDKLYLKLEKDRSFILYGDYKTDLNETKLAAYNRSFNGLKYELNEQPFKLRAFLSRTDQIQMLDALPGRGISGYYYLSERLAVEGSERVVIEVRDRYRPDTVLRRESKGRGSDYEIDYSSGALLFKEAIPSHDEDYNPVYIVVSYESRTTGENYYIYGGRGSSQIRDWLELGATGVVEEKGLGDYHLLGTDLTMRLPGKTVVKAEYAQTKGIFEEESLFGWYSDHGWSMGLESEPLAKLHLGGYYRKLGDHFLNLSAADAARGTTKYGFDATYELRPDTELRGKFFDERDDLNQIGHRLATIDAQTKFNKTKIMAELSDESSSEAYVPLATPRSPFDISQETPGKLTAAKLGLESELSPDLALTLSHKHNLWGESYHTSQAGLKYRLDNLNRLYLREEYQKYQERSEARTLLGVEAQLRKDTVAFNEYRLANGADGARTQSVLGLRNKFFLGKEITGNLSGEYLKTVSGSQREGEPDAVALTLALEYLASEEFKATGRFEHREELDGKGLNYLAEVGLACKLDPDYSLLLRERYFYQDSGTGQQTTSRAMVGLAYRPLLANRFNALTKAEYKHESNSGSIPTFREKAWIFAGEGVWQATPRLQLTGKYAGKLARDNGFASYTDLLAARFLYDLTDRWDAGGEYRILTSHKVNSSYQGGTVEIGYRIIKNLWVGTGYSFDKFDADLTGDSYQGEGPFLKLRAKFDETTFKGRH